MADENSVPVMVVPTLKSPSIAAPRIRFTQDEYKPDADRSYYRNNGNKHIKSRGL